MWVSLCSAGCMAQNLKCDPWRYGLDHPNETQVIYLVQGLIPGTRKLQMLIPLRIRPSLPTGMKERAEFTRPFQVQKELSWEHVCIGFIAHLSILPTVNFQAAKLSDRKKAIVKTIVKNPSFPLLIYIAPMCSLVLSKCMANTEDWIVTFQSKPGKV